MLSLGSRQHAEQCTAKCDAIQRPYEQTCLLSASQCCGGSFRFMLMFGFNYLIKFGWWGRAVLLPPPPPGLLGLPLKLLWRQPHVRRSEAALVEIMHILRLTTG